MRCEYCGNSSKNENEFITINLIDYLMKYNNPQIVGTDDDIFREYTLCSYTWCQSKVFGRVTEGCGEFPATVNLKLVERFKKEKEERERKEKEKEERLNREWRERAKMYAQYK